MNGHEEPNGAAVPQVLRGILALGAAGAALWMLSACASNPWMEGRPDPRLGANCVRVSAKGPLIRVTNYADPELCGRFVAQRGPYRVRTVPQPQPETAQLAGERR